MRYFSYILVFVISINSNLFSFPKFNGLITINTDDGLSHNSVNITFQDSKGSVWIGTQYGLNKYNGADNVKYFFNDKKSNFITGLYEDSFLRIWISTLGGIYYYDMQTDRLIKVKLENRNLINTEFTRMQLVNDIMVLFSSKQVILINKSKFSNTVPNNVLIPQIINLEYANSIININENIFFIATLHKGIWQFNYKTGELEKNNSLPAIQGITINGIFARNDSAFWITTEYNYLMSYNYKTGHLEHFKQKNNNFKSLADNTISLVYTDTRKRIWIVTGIGISFYDEKKRAFENNLFNHSDEIMSIYEDNEGNFWLSTEASGVLFLKNGLANSFFKNQNDIFSEPMLKETSVLSILSQNEMLLIGTDWDGLFTYKKGILYEHKSKTNKIILSDAIKTMFLDSKDQIWLGCYDGGITVLDKNMKLINTFIAEVNFENELTNNSVEYFCEDKNGNIWIATNSGGLNKYDVSIKKFTVFSKLKNELSSDYTTYVFNDSENLVWVGTYYGLNCIDPKTNNTTFYISSDTIKSSISSNWIYAIHEDKNGRLWIGTADGLNLFNKKNATFTSFTIKEGLSGNKIYSIIEHGNFLWLATDKGITKFNLDSHSCTIFDKNDGIPDEEFNRAAFFKSKKGEIFFGSKAGFVYFNPDSIKKQIELPLVKFTSLKIDDNIVNVNGKNSPLKKTLEYSKEITLKHHQSNITINFIAINYNLKDKIKYSYQLEGLNQQWSNIGSQRSITFANLAPGTYDLKVKASYSSYNWGPNFENLRIVVLPPFWKTIPAYVFYTICILIALYLYRKYTIISVNRKKQLVLEKLEREKNEEIVKAKLAFFTNISHEIRTPLTLILGPLERKILKSGPDKELLLIKRNVKNLYKLINQLLDFRKMDNGRMDILYSNVEIVKFIQNLLLAFEAEASERNLNFEFSSNISYSLQLIDSDKIEKIISNLVSNSFKFTESGFIKVALTIISHPKKTEHKRYNNGYIKIQVSDSGKGMCQETIKHIFDRFYSTTNTKVPGSGIGLSITKKFIDLLDGEIIVESELNTGSSFIVFIPLIENSCTLEKDIDKNTDREGGGFSFVFNKSLDLNKPAIENSTFIDYSDDTNTILIVDDNKDIRQYIRHIFYQNYKIIEEENGIKALESAKMHNPDLIISDVMMPEMGGFELCQNIKKDIALSHIPIILLTARNSDSDIIKGLKVGANDYIKKPFNETVLKSKVTNILQTREKFRKYFMTNADINELKKIGTNPIEHQFISQVLEIIDKNLSNSQFSINTILDELNMSKSVFYRKVKVLTNSNINELIRNLRLKKARELLLSQKYSIGDIAEKVGFRDQSYFSKVFKEYFGHSPSNLLENVRF